MGVSRYCSQRLLCYSTAFLILVSSQFFISPAYANSVSLSVWLNDQIYTLSLESHSVKGLADTSKFTHYKGAIEGVEGSWARVSEFENSWEGVVSLNGELFVIEINNTANSRALQTNVISGKPASQFSELGACELRHKDGAETTTDKKALQLSTHTAETASFSTLCTNKVDGICLLAELDFVFDQDFQNTFPTDYQSRAVELINIMEGYYENDLSISFQTLTTTFLTSTVFSTTTDSITY